jgi:endonuclease/exonuclease/phosphatase family metal-dependent hydrolase
MRTATLALASLLAGLAGCGPAAPRPAVRGAAVIRLATWNVHDLFDEVDRLEPPGALDERPGAGEVEARLAAVAAVLVRLDADAVLLQEVEDLPLLRRLAARCGYPEARLLEGNDPRGIDVALLSRLPVVAYLGHAGEAGADGRWLWPRDAVEAVLTVGDQRVVLVGTHLSSRLSDPAGVRRALQAARLRALADGAEDRWGAALVVAGGDLNDDAAAPALRPLLGDGAWHVAAPGRWTWSDGASRAVLDHLAVRAVDAGALLAAAVAEGGDVAAASDHRPVVIDLLVR